MAFNLPLMLVNLLESGEEHASAKALAQAVSTSRSVQILSCTFEDYLQCVGVVG